MKRLILTRSASYFTFLLLCLILLPPASALAVEKPQPTPGPIDSFGGSVDVNVVNVDVFVRDSKGNPVMGLKADDFLLSRDGIRQEISNFAVVTEELIQTRLQNQAQLMLPPPPAEEKKEAELHLRPIWVVLYVDNENLDPIDRTRALRRIRQFVTESLHPPMQMMVVSNQAGLKILQTFTTDPREINSALRSIGNYSGGWEERQGTRLKIIEDMRDANAQGSSSNRQRGRSTGIGQQQGMYQQILAAAREEANDLDFSLMALRQIVDTLAGLNGRKSILYLSNGLPMTPGLGLMHEYATLYQDNSILSSRGRFDHQAQFQALAARASSQEINFYTVDAEGLNVGLGGGAESSYSGDPTASRVGETNFQGSMRYMAERTGGIAVINTNDISEGLSKIRDDFYAYYSLGFKVRNEANDSVHRIEVTLPEHKKLDVRYRKRFVARSLESKIQDRVSSALLLDIDDNSMGLLLLHGKPSPAAGEHWIVPLHIEVPLDKIVMIPTNKDVIGRVELFVGARDLDGRQSDLQRQHHEIRFKAEEEQPKHWKYDTSLLMSKGAQRVVIALLDEISHKVSYASMTLSVP